MAKEKKQKKAKETTADEKVSIAGYPRAASSIRRTKARGGLIGFFIGALVSWMHGGLMPSVLIHGLEGGIAGYLACWFAAVTVWRHVIHADLKSALERHKAATAAAAAAASE